MARIDILRVGPRGCPKPVKLVITIWPDTLEKHLAWHLAIGCRAVLRKFGFGMWRSRSWRMHGPRHAGLQSAWKWMRRMAADNWTWPSFVSSLRNAVTEPSATLRLQVLDSPRSRRQRLCCDNQWCAPPSLAYVHLSNSRLFHQGDGSSHTLWTWRLYPTTSPSPNTCNKSTALRIHTWFLEI